ncbi:BA14K family protein [Rhodoligotrophos ferricapiens]|uniref:BA14K family protein n=1 Tax=Rhodoligotrophos ferricapiens TaxID=3069264 RepID=UPI00315D0EEC
MARKTLTIAAGLLMFGVAALGGTPPQASAAPIGSVLKQASTAADANSLIHEVQSRRYRGSYHRHRHGPRYRHRRPGYRYYHGGYYYRTPWWLGAAAAAGIAGTIAGAAAGAARGAAASSHVAWCQQRYRSYNPATDTFTGYDGRQYRCNSPY